MRKSLFGVALLSFVCLEPALAQSDDQLDDAAPSAQVASTVSATAGDAVYDHEAYSINCGGRITGGGCRLTVDEGDPVTLQVVRSVPGVLSVNVNKIDKKPSGLSQADFDKLTKGLKPAQTAEERACPNPCDSAFECYGAITSGLQELQRSINHDLSTYGEAICRLRGAHERFTSGVGVNSSDGAAVQKAFFGMLSEEQLQSVPSAEAFAAFWPRLRALVETASDELSSFLPYEVEYGDRDFDLELTFTSNHPELIKAPEGKKTVQVRLRNGWDVSTSTALMVSGLVNDDFTTETYTVKVGDADVEKRRSVREDRDVVAPEIAFLVNLLPKAPSTWGRSIISVGVGMSQESGGRLYGTYGRRFGQAGAWHFGVALGRVKRLSANVNEEDLGTVDPNASRRDVMRPSFTVGISWRLTE